MHTLKSLLQNTVSLSSANWELLSQKFIPMKIAKGEKLISIGDQPSQIAIVASGVFKTSIKSQIDDKLVIKSFQGKGDFVGAYADYLRVKSSQVEIAAIASAEIYVCSFEDLEQLTNNNLELEQLRRKLTEKMLLQKDDRENQLLSLDAQGRFESFQIQFESVADRIPDYLVASYLNITASYLSTMKKRQNLPNQTTQLM
jgi:CRP-like cAMP-binding protein